MGRNPTHVEDHPADESRSEFAEDLQIKIAHPRIELSMLSE
jgi:hypothetical protein